MFSYPQPLLFPVLFISPNKSGATELLYKPFGLLLELGRVSEAERVAIEMLESAPTGAALKRPGADENDQGPAGRLRAWCLNVLRDDLVWGQWAERYLRRLAADPDLAGDEEIQRIAGIDARWKTILICTSQFRSSTTVSIDPGGMLLDLLKRNPENRMAFEYLMAIRLCNSDVQRRCHCSLSWTACRIRRLLRFTRRR